MQTAPKSGGCLTDARGISGFNPERLSDSAVLTILMNFFPDCDIIYDLNSEKTFTRSKLRSFNDNDPFLPSTPQPPLVCALGTAFALHQG